MRWMWWLCVAACGGGGGAKPDAAVDATPDVALDGAFGAPSDVYPAFHPPVPHAVSMGGQVLATPRVVEIFFADDPLIAQLEDFTTKFATSPEWTTMVGEYGVGPITVGTPVVLSTNAPASMTDMDTRAMLASQLDGNHPEWGPVDAPTLASTIYVFHIPLGVAYTSGTTVACQDFQGYHSSAKVNFKPTQFAVINSCTPPPFLASTLDLDTASESHELVETVTDPQIDAYNALDDVGRHWGFGGGAELGDLCEHTHDSWYKPDDLGYEIQRSWSNASIASYHVPCVPALPTEPVFFAAIPSRGEPFPVTLTDSSVITVTGTKTKLGTPTTIALELISDGPTAGPFTVDAFDLPRTGSSNVLQLDLDRTSGQNGEIIHLTITPMSRPTAGFELFTIRATLGSAQTVWRNVVWIDP